MPANSDLELQEILMEDKGMEMLADMGFHGNACKVTLSDRSTILRYAAFIVNQIMKNLVF